MRHQRIRKVTRTSMGPYGPSWSLLMHICSVDLDGLRIVPIRAVSTAAYLPLTAVRVLYGLPSKISKSSWFLRLGASYDRQVAFVMFSIDDSGI